MNNPNQNQTDIFGNEITFQNQPDIQQGSNMENVQANQNVFQQQMPIYQSSVQNVNISPTDNVQNSTTVIPQANHQQPGPSYQNQTSEFVQPFKSNEELRVVDIISDQKPEIQNQSFTEMPFAGVNQQQEEARRVTILESQPTVMNVETQVERTSNMEPIQKQEDENSGLKFLLVLGIIFAVVIILLPYL